MLKYTPKPWIQCYERTGETEIFTEHGDTIAMVRDTANANIIVMAPDMYEMLKQVEEIFRIKRRPYKHETTHLEQIIAKAEDR